jgi:hypothetical protein
MRIIGVGWGIKKAMSYPARIFINVPFCPTKCEVNWHFKCLAPFWFHATNDRGTWAILLTVMDCFRFDVDLNLHRQFVVAITPIRPGQGDSLLGITSHGYPN